MIYNGLTWGVTSYGCIWEWSQHLVKDTGTDEWSVNHNGFTHWKPVRPPILWMTSHKLLSSRSFRNSPFQWLSKTPGWDPFRDVVADELKRTLWDAWTIIVGEKWFLLWLRTSPRVTTTFSSLTSSRDRQGFGTGGEWLRRYQVYRVKMSLLLVRDLSVPSPWQGVTPPPSLLTFGRGIPTGLKFSRGNFERTEMTGAP